MNTIHFILAQGSDSSGSLMSSQFEGDDTVAAFNFDQWIITGMQKNISDYN